MLSVTKLKHVNDMAKKNFNGFNLYATNVLITLPVNIKNQNDDKMSVAVLVLNLAGPFVR